jgi:hypothetical protein
MQQGEQHPARGAAADGKARSDVSRGEHGFREMAGGAGVVENLTIEFGQAGIGGDDAEAPCVPGSTLDDGKRQNGRHDPSSAGAAAGGTGVAIQGERGRRSGQAQRRQVARQRPGNGGLRHWTVAAGRLGIVVIPWGAGAAPIDLDTIHAM